MKNFKNQLLALLISGALSSLASVAVAQDDLCGNLPGTWKGTGKIKWFLFTCEYSSTATITQGLTMSAQVSVKKVGGSFFCPREGDQNVQVFCSGNRVEMKDSKIDVAGDLSGDGKHVHLKGNLYTLLKYHPFELTATKVD